MEQPSKLPTIERNEAPPNYFFMFKITIICTTFLLSFMKFGGLVSTSPDLSLSLVYQQPLSSLVSIFSCVWTVGKR